MLVVLIIVGMVAAISVDSLSRVFDLRARLSAYLDAATASRMTMNWLRRSTTNLVSDLATSPNRFRGTASEFSGITLAPLGEESGIPTATTWRFTPDSQTRGVRLEYRTGSANWVTVASWPERTGSFTYDGGDGQWVSEWPPAFQSPTLPQIPRYIRVMVGRGSDAWSIVMSPVGNLAARQPTANIRDVLGVQSQSR